VQVRWQRYCAQAGVSCTLRQLRHAHATEVVHEGVRVATPDPHLTYTLLPPPRRDAERSAAPTGGPQPQPSDIVGYLRQCKPFNELPDAALAEVALQARCGIYRRGALYLDPAEALGRFYVIVRGSVGFYRLAPDGHKLTLDINREGAFFWIAAREWVDGVKSNIEVLSGGTLLCDFAPWRCLTS
jgi:hypothetical protein